MSENINGKSVTVSVTCDSLASAARAPVALRLRYIGTGSVTSVTVTTAVSIVTVTVEGGTTTTKTYLFASGATLNTVLKLVNAIRADGLFEVKVLDTLLSFPTASQFIDGAITLSASEEGYPIWDVKVDTDAADYLMACLDPQDRMFLRPLENHRVHLVGYEYTMDQSAAAANGEQVWIRQGLTETQKIGRLSVDHATTVTTRNFASGEGALSAPYGAQIIVLVDDPGNLANADGNYLQVDGVIE
jgi:hypothetical protein